VAFARSLTRVIDLLQEEKSHRSFFPARAYAGSPKSHVGEHAYIPDAPLIQEYLPNKPITAPVSPVFPDQQPGFVKMQPLTARKSPCRSGFYVGEWGFPEQPGMGTSGQPISSLIDLQQAGSKRRAVLGIGVTPVHGVFISVRDSGGGAPRQPGRFPVKHGLSQDASNGSNFNL